MCVCAWYFKKKEENVNEWVAFVWHHPKGKTRYKQNWFQLWDNRNFKQNKKILKKIINYQEITYKELQI